MISNSITQYRMQIVLQKKSSAERQTKPIDQGENFITITKILNSKCPATERERERVKPCTTKPFADD